MHDGLDESFVNIKIDVLVVCEYEDVIDYIAMLMMMMVVMTLITEILMIMMITIMHASLPELYPL